MLSIAEHLGPFWAGSRADEGDLVVVTGGDVLVVLVGVLVHCTCMVWLHPCLLHVNWLACGLHCKAAQLHAEPGCHYWIRLSVFLIPAWLAPNHILCPDTWTPTPLA